MDTALLTTRGFWQDAAPFSAGSFGGELPEIEELSNHVLFQTSGSSGVPKWIALSKSALLASAEAVNAHLEVDANSCWGLALPIFHVGGFGVAARSYAAGCGFREFGKRWDASAFRSWLEEEAVTHTSLVPAQIHDLVLAGLRAPGNIRAIVVGGGLLPAETGSAARALGWPVLASYGMTEAASQIATQAPAALAHPYQPFPIPLLPLWRAELSPEKLLRIAGPALFSGTLIARDGTWIYQPRDGGWHETRDRVTLENDAITPLGRADTMVKVLGELVDPEEIEREIAALSGGKLALGSFAVVAIPDARAEHALVPVFNRGVPIEQVENVLKHHAAQLPGWLKLRPFVLLDPLPRSPLGKPLRERITEMVRATNA